MRDWIDRLSFRTRVVLTAICHHRRTCVAGTRSFRGRCSQYRSLTKIITRLDQGHEPGRACRAQGDRRLMPALVAFSGRQV
jgi:hypothetical protein